MDQPSSYSSPASLPPPDLDRHRAWQWLSIALLLVGAVLAIGALAIASAVASDPSLRADRGTLIAILVVGEVLLLIGAVANAVRALVVRAALPRERYRGPAVLVLLILAICLSVPLGFIFAGDAEVLATGSGELSLVGSAILLTSTQVALLLLAWLLVLRPNALAGARLVESSGLGRAIWLGVLWGVPAWLLASIVAAIASALLGQFGIQPEPEAAQQAIGLANPIIAVVATVIIAPIAEELFFRGVAFNAWMREYGARRAMVGSALLFALIHASLAALLPIFALGVALVLIYRRTGNLASSMAMHATFNGISVALALLVRYDVIRLPT